MQLLKKKKKTLGINLAKHVQDLYVENYKTSFLKKKKKMLPLTKEFINNSIILKNPLSSKV